MERKDKNKLIRVLKKIIPLFLTKAIPFNFRDSKIYILKEPPLKIVRNFYQRNGDENEMIEINNCLIEQNIIKIACSELRNKSLYYLSADWREKLEKLKEDSKSDSQKIKSPSLSQKRPLRVKKHILVDQRDKEIFLHLYAAIKSETFNIRDIRLILCQYGVAADSWCFYKKQKGFLSAVGSQKERGKSRFFIYKINKEKVKEVYDV